MFRSFRQPLLAVALAAFALALASPRAEAIPPFARKYHTSCATCHTAFPNLNSFGEAFKRLGYRFPGRKDEDMTKEETVALGADSYKKVYPKAIWPDSIAGSAPIGVLLESSASFNNPRTGSKGVSFEDVGKGSDLLAGGTFDETYSYFGEWGVDFNKIELERGFVTIANVLGGDSGLYLKIGRFVPDFFEFSNKLRLVGGDDGRFRAHTMSVADNGFALQDPAMRGFEFSGFLGSDSTFNAGWVQAEASTPNPALGADPGNRKDFYFHIDHKFIGDDEQGYRLDGTPAHAIQSDKQGAAAQASDLEDQPWGDSQSLTLGAFYFNGGTVLTNNPDPTLVTVRQLDDFRSFGGDAAFIDHQWKLHAAIAKTDHDLPDFGSILPRGAFTWMVEANYAWHPCLFTSLRYENFNQDEHITDTSPSPDLRRFVPSLVYMARANVKFSLQAFIDDTPASGTGSNFEKAIFGVALGF